MGCETEDAADCGEQNGAQQPCRRCGARRGEAGGNGPSQRVHGPGRGGGIKPQAERDGREGGDPVQVADAAAEPRLPPEEVAGGDSEKIGYGEIEQFQWTRSTREMV